MMAPDFPFSRDVIAASVPRTGQTAILKPSADELTAIATFLDLPAVDSLQAKITVTPARGRSFHVTGDLEAMVHQRCVVSLEPFPSVIRESIDVRFAPQDKLPPAAKAEVERLLTDEDPPEPLTDGLINIGQLAVEALALGLDAFPRKPGVETPLFGDKNVRESPFAALAALKKPPLS
jgi:uncharacterized metal-binding protein YceD (DUF177 family)